MTHRTLRVLATPADVAAEAARMVIEAAHQTLARRNRFALGLAGGATPAPLYRALGSLAFSSQIDWERVELFFTDERCVPPDHADSNWGMVRETLLDRLPTPPAAVHRIRGEIEPEAAAIEYGRMLKARFGEGGLDLAILGMGEDGHTASLFPHTAALAATHHRCLANYVQRLSAWRITMTAPFLNRSLQVLVLVTGAAKAPRLRQVLDGPAEPQRLPIQLINPRRGKMTWLIDSAAAG